MKEVLRHRVYERVYRLVTDRLDQQVGYRPQARVQPRVLDPVHAQVGSGVLAPVAVRVGEEARRNKWTR